MKRKPILAGACAVLALALIVLIAGRKGWNNNDRDDYSQAVLTSDGKLTFKPGARGTMTVVVDQRVLGHKSPPPTNSASR